MSIFFLSLLFPLFCFADMSVEEKVGQLLMVHFCGESVNDDAKTLIEKAHVGGIIYYNWANGLTSPQQVKQLSANLQKLSKTPLLIAVDQEGGRVNRLVQGFTVFPSNAEMAQQHSPEYIQEAASVVGKELFAVGVNLNFAPVIDVNVHPNNSAIGNRSYGSSPNEVAICGAYALKGYRQAKIICTLKHFPGQGDVSIDTHVDLPVLNKTKAELEAVELLPYQKLIPTADVIMTAHIIVPEYDTENCATLSPTIIDGLLRKQMHFDGVVITDSLVMKGLLKSCKNVEEAAVRAILAGCDIVLLGGKQLVEHEGNFELSVDDVLKIHQSLVKAVQDGVISQERLDQSVARIQKLKTATRIQPHFSQDGPD